MPPLEQLPVVFVKPTCDKCKAKVTAVFPEFDHFELFIQPSAGIEADVLQAQMNFRQALDYLIRACGSDFAPRDADDVLAAPNVEQGGRIQRDLIQPKIRYYARR